MSIRRTNVCETPTPSFVWNCEIAPPADGHNSLTRVCFSFVPRIEHLFPETETNLPFNIFGFMKPKVIVFTTPNSDYNVLFGAAKFPNGFRHDDHKFEWSREQHRDW